MSKYHMNILDDAGQPLINERHAGDCGQHQHGQHAAGPFGHIPCPLPKLDQRTSVVGYYSIVNFPAGPTSPACAARRY